MGWDIISVGQHKLDTSSIESLAKYLSNKLSINIIYGSFEVATYCKETHTLNIDYKKDFVEFGKFATNNLGKFYHLVDDSHCYKEILNKIDNIESLNLNLKGEYYSNKTEILKEILFNYSKQHVKYRLYIESSKDLNLYETFNIDVLKDTILVDIIEPFRWFGFLDIFIEEIEEYRKKYFFDYRKELKQLYILLGSTQIIFFADQGVGECILDKVWESNWNDLIKYIQDKAYYNDSLTYNDFTKKEVEDAIHLNISDFFLKNYSLYSEHSDFINVLFDDFKDLK